MSSKELRSEYEANLYLSGKRPSQANVEPPNGTLAYRIKKLLEQELDALPEHDEVDVYEYK